MPPVRLLAQGQQAPARCDADEFTFTQQRYHAHPRLRRQYQSSLSWLLRAKLIALALLPGVLFAHLGFRSALPWGPSSSRGSSVCSCATAACRPR
ncbi:MAG: hypothetical protein E6K70_19840 [Planctomycetota bacterium]|nr:MAG: hypothetical protein E6K70_19840 [Planctomycetota bacterium]